MQDGGRGLNKRNNIMERFSHKGEMMLTNWLLIDEEEDAKEEKIFECLDFLESMNIVM